MKTSSIACAGFVALAALAITAEGASAQSQSTSVNSSRSNVKNNSPVVTNPNTGNTKQPCLDPTGKPIPGKFQPNCVAAQSSAVNTSRSNTKNNFVQVCLDAKGNPTAHKPPCPTGESVGMRAVTQKGISGH